MLVHAPVLGLYPSAAFLWVPVSCPRPQHLEEDVRQSSEVFLTTYRAVAGPTYNHRIQPSVEPLLVHVVGTNRSSKFSHVSLYCCFARFDDCLKAKRLSVTIHASIGLSHQELPDMKSQKIESGFTIRYSIPSKLSCFRLRIPRLSRGHLLLKQSCSPSACG